MVLQDKGGKPPTFPIVCIGGSAGSLAACIDILKEMPAKAGVAIVIVSHRAIRDSDGVLIRLLAKVTEMEVVEAVDEIPLERGCVFVSPPHRQLTTDGVILRLVPGLTENHGWPTVIDDFMFSMASTYTSRAIAIIVSGMGLDGSAGLSAVKEAGGWTLAQSDASWPDMPQAAIDTNDVDLVLRAAEIGKYLASLNAHLPGQLQAKQRP